MMTFEYAFSFHTKLLRGVCRSFRDVLDDRENVVWKNILEKHSKPMVQSRILWGKSVGVTALIVRESVVQNRCVSCRLWFNLKKNYLHDLLLCGRCSKKQVFRVVNLRKACFNYFLDYQVQKENHLLVKARKGRAFDVLLNDVRNMAFAKYPDGELQRKMNARFCKAFKTELRKQQEKEKRVREIGYKFCDILWQSPSRVDLVLRDQGVLKDLVQKFGSREHVFGDTFDRRVRAAMKCQVAAQHLYDYGAMLTYMRKLNLLDHRYEVTSGHRCNPYNIYRHHVNEGLHFYELSRLHADSKEELRSRAREVETYLLRNKINEKERKALAVAMCAEESMNYSPEDFNGFVLRQEGNPVHLARHKREQEFLHQNHLAWETNNFLVAGHDPGYAQKLGTCNVLHRTKGYPPMMRTCVINLSTTR